MCDSRSDADPVSIVNRNQKESLRTGFVLSTIALALPLGIIAGISESRLLARALIIGFAPAVWAASYVIERLTGRDMWHFTASYPYPWMRESGDAASTPPNAPGKPVDNIVEADDRSTLALAA